LILFYFSHTASYQEGGWPQKNKLLNKFGKTKIISKLH
jgi:hypothetical protein